MSKIIDIRSIATTEQWNDWHWQLQNRITTFEELAKYIEHWLSPPNARSEWLLHRIIYR
jgi:L-lysine 2,3-aminomutase